MKKYILLLIIPFLSFGQEIVINGDGKKIILNEDGTWELFESKEIIASIGERSLHFINGECSYISYSGEKQTRIIPSMLEEPIKFPSMENEVFIKNFDIQSHEILDYDKTHEYYILIDKNGNSGFKYAICDSINSGLGKDTLFTNKSSLINYLTERNVYRRLNKNPKHPIEIESIIVSNINSAGGVDIEINWHYLNKKKDIKYIVFTVMAFNSVGDAVSGSYSGSKVNLEATGPIEAGAYTKYNNYGWENVWYNNTISCAKIVKVNVTYMDGSNYIYVNELDKISSPYLKYYCFE
tara:strand:- start:47 stop:931 length:885 start_codon:yes stop_codon:yes gene_type:complete